MKIYILLSRFPYPLEKGDKLRAYYQIKELSKTHEIHLACLNDTTIKKSWIDELDKFCKSISIFKLKKTLIWWNTAKKLFSDKPYQVGYFYQKWIQRKISNEIAELKPDHIYCQLIRTADYVKNIHNIPKTIDYQDALSAGMLRRSEISTGLKKSLFRSEGRRLSAYENRIFDYFNHHTIISEQDRALINHPKNSEIKVVENGVSEAFFNYTLPSVKTKDIVFTGNMNYPPNIECSEFIVEKIFPLINQEHSIILSGASPHQRIKDLGQNKNITVTGWVDDIRTSYASAKIFVAPLFIGTGLQNKLLEAMAMGLPCVTTPLVNNALKAKNGKEILIAENAVEFAEHINTLLNNKKTYEQISTHGKAYVAKEFSWAHSVKKLNLLFSKTK